MSKEGWNVFDLFVEIETKINFSADLIFTDDPQLDTESPVQSCSHCFSENINSTRLPGTQPLGTDLGDKGTDCSKNEYRCLFGNILVPVRDRRHSFAFNPCSYGFMQNHRLGEYCIKSARVAEMRRRQELVYNFRDPSDTPAALENRTPVHRDNKADEWKRIDKGRTQEFDYTNGQLVILWLNSILLFGFIVRLTLNCRRKSYHTSALGMHNISSLTTPPVDVNGPNSISSSAVWQEYLTDALCSDLFARLTNRFMVNMLTAGLLVPSGALRLIRIKRYLPIYLRNWLSETKQSLWGLTGSGPDTMGEKRVINGPAGVTPERLNIVRIDLCYLKSIHTSLGNWFQMLTKSWFHKHNFGNFLHGREMMTKFCRGNDKGGNQSSATCDLRTKMYHYNFINFDWCYVKYFQQTDASNAKPQHNQATIASQHHRLTIGDLTMSKTVDQDDNRKEESAAGDCCAERKKSPTGESKRRKMFVAEPLHRIDLTEMGWLLAALALLYSLSVLVLTWQALFSFLTETDMKAFSDISLSRMIIELRQFVTSFALARWLLINLLDAIIILTVFDLYQFFACCLICLSRARYLMFRMERMSDYFRMTSHLLELEQRLLDRMDTKLNRINDSQMSKELVALTSFEKRLKSNNQRKRGEQKTSRISPASMSAVRELDSELEFVLKLIVIVHQELVDLKNFFSLYLNLELASKSLCMTLAICAIFDSNNVFELCYLMAIFITCTMPIFITMTTAAFIENQFKGICRNLDRIIMMGGSIMSVSNLRQASQLTSFLSFKANRSFVVLGNFSLSLQSLVPILAWIATGVVMIRRERA